MQNHFRSTMPAPLRIAHLGTYPPRRCGIATYTQDVVSALEQFHPTGCPTVIAMASPSENITYEGSVQRTIRQESPQDYRSAAKFLNTQGSELLSIQFEHGIFGGADGMLLSELLYRLDIPAVATLHTVLPNPSRGQIAAVRMLWRQCQALVVLNERALPLLENAYEIDTSKVSVIPHGTPQVDITQRPAIRKRLGLTDRRALMTFGLLGPGKGIEQAIDALAQIADKHPNTDYYILGQTHPELVRNYGESYRTGLLERVAAAGLEDRVRFVNRYLSLEEICDWLVACDIYLTPYQNPNQITSGTLAYAVAAGCPVVSTPYLHASELLSAGRGLLTPFGDTTALAQNISYLLSNDEARQAISRAAYAYGESTTWQRTAERYSTLFQGIVPAQQSQQSQQSVLAAV